MYLNLWKVKDKLEDLDYYVFCIILPRRQLTIFTLAPSRAFNEILKHIPSCLILNLARIFILSNVTRAVGWIVYPIFYYFLSKEIPMHLETFLSGVFAIII
jgi:hypothetical protein